MATPSGVATDAVESQVLSSVHASKMTVLTGFFNQIKENAAASFREAKPWSEVVDRASFSRPATSAEALSRLRWNTAYFRVNYVLVALGTTALVMAFRPWSLLVLAALAGVWFYAYVLRSTPFSWNGREISEREKLLGLTGASLVIIFLLTSVGTTLFYALGLSAALISAHAVFKVPDDLFLDAPPETAPGGLFALFTGAGRAATTGAGVPPSVVTAV